MHGLSSLAFEIEEKTQASREPRVNLVERRVLGAVGLVTAVPAEQRRNGNRFGEDEGGWEWCGDGKSSAAG